MEPLTKRWMIRRGWEPPWPGAVSGANIVGYYVDTNGNTHGFRYDGVTFKTLDDPLGIGNTYATGISGSNIVGYYYDSDDNTHGFLYNGTIYTPLDDSLGVGLTSANGISGTQIVGYYVDIDGNDDGFLATGVGGATGAVSGKYTLLLTATDTTPGFPQGIGYATLTLSAKNKGVIAGKLPDGENFRATASVVNGGSGYGCSISAPLAYAAASSKGSLTGTLAFVQITGSSDFNGTFEWVKPVQKKGRYTAAIDTDLNVIGSYYTYVKSGSVLPGFTAGTLELSDTGTLSLSGSGPLIKQLTLSKSLFTVTDPGSDKLHLKRDRQHRRFQGHRPLSGKVGAGRLRRRPFPGSDHRWRPVPRPSRQRFGDALPLTPDSRFGLSCIGRGFPSIVWRNAFPSLLSRGDRRGCLRGRDRGEHRVLRKDAGRGGRPARRGCEGEPGPRDDSRRQQRLLLAPRPDDGQPGPGRREEGGPELRPSHRHWNDRRRAGEGTPRYAGLLHGG